MRRAFVAALLIAIGGVLTGWGCPGAAGAPQEQEIKIRAGEFWFKPNAVTMKAGPARFLVKNDGLVAHTYVIEKVKDARIDEFDPGKTGTLRITLKSGRYKAFCDVPGHREAGMEMTITVQ